MSRTLEEIYQNLLDAGYTRATADRFMTYVNSGDLASQQRDLSLNRTKILETSSGEPASSMSGLSSL